MSELENGDVFVGELVLVVPATRDEYGRKMPGHCDANGDHCN